MTGRSRRTLFNDVVVPATSLTMRRTPSLVEPKGRPGNQPPSSSPLPGWPMSRLDRSQGTNLFIYAVVVTIRAALLETLDLTLSTSQTRGPGVPPSRRRSGGRRSREPTTSPAFNDGQGTASLFLGGEGEREDRLKALN
jgi:hypothetical protein